MYSVEPTQPQQFQLVLQG